LKDFSISNEGTIENNDEFLTSLNREQPWPVRIEYRRNDGQSWIEGFISTLLIFTLTRKVWTINEIEFQIRPTESSRPFEINNSETLARPGVKADGDEESATEWVILFTLGILCNSRFIEPVRRMILSKKFDERYHFTYYSVQLIYNFENPVLTVQIIKKHISPECENKEKIYFEGRIWLQTIGIEFQ